MLADIDRIIVVKFVRSRTCFPIYTWHRSKGEADDLETVMVSSYISIVTSHQPQRDKGLAKPYSTVPYSAGPIVPAFSWGPIQYRD